VETKEIMISQNILIYAIRNIFEGADISKEAFTEKGKTQITDSDFLNGLAYKEAMATVIERLEKDGSGEGTINYRLRDAIFSRQRYWGEPIPVYYKNGLPICLKPENLPLVLPEVEQYLPTPEGAPPLGNATIWAWDTETKKLSPIPRLTKLLFFL